MRGVYDATWGRAFSAIYDRGLQASERAGLRRMRRELLSAAQGQTLELGAGTGANLALYPEQVAELFLLEPDKHMVRRLRSKLRRDPRPRSEVVRASAEAVPFADSSFDTAVFTLALCTIPDPSAALAEVARVLRPGGRMLFLEHVRSEDRREARWQDRLEGLWYFFGDGCHCNRDTVATIESSPLQLEKVERDQLPKGLFLVRPLRRGSAVLPS